MGMEMLRTNAWTMKDKQNLKGLLEYCKSAGATTIDEVIKHLEKLVIEHQKEILDRLPERAGGECPNCGNINTRIWKVEDSPGSIETIVVLECLSC